MNAKVGFNEVQNYAKTHNIDFKTAAQKLGLTAKEAADLEKLGGTPEAPQDGFQRKPAHSFTLKSGRKVNVYKDATGKQTFEYLAADGTKLKEAYFLKQEGLTGSHFVVMGNGQLGTVKNPEQQQKKEEETSWWSKAGNFIKENAGSLIAGAAVVAGAICCATGVGASVGVPLLLVGGAIGLSSCTSEDPTEFNTNINVSVSIPPSDQSALIEAFKEGIDALLAKMDELGYKVDKYGDQIIKLLIDNNAYLKSIADNLEKQGIKQDEIIEILTNINSTANTISSLLEATNENIVINGQNVSEKLEEILNAIKSGQASSLEALEGYIETLKQLLLDVIENQEEDIIINEENGMTLDQIYDILVNMDGMTSEKLEQMLKILQSIESIGKDINSKLDAIIEKFEDSFADNSEILEALNRIEEYIKENNDKADVTNNLLEQLLEQYNSGGITQEDLQKLLDAIAANGDKIDATNQLLAKIQNQDENFQKQVLEMLANVGPDYSEVLNKILDATQGNSTKLDAIAQLLAKMQNQDAEFQKNVLNILGNIGADYTEVLNKILEATQGNSTKLDAIAQLLAKIQDQDEKFQKQVLDFIAKGNTDYTDILNKILEAAENNGTKLDALGQLLAKIQNQDENFQKQVLELLAKVGPDYSEVLNKILDATQGNSTKLDAIAQLLAKMQNQDAEFQKNVLNILGNVGTDYTEVLNKILEATQGNSQKLTDITQLLAKMQNQDAEFQKNILDAINQLGIEITGQLNNILNSIKNISVGGGDSSNIEALLNKVLEKMDSNTAAIIEAIGNIKPGEGGTVDLSSVEKMLKELIELTAKNNDLLEKINAKVEVISVTQQAILEKINSFENMGCDTSKLESLLKEILDKMGQQSGSYDDSKLLEILNNLTAKFEEYSKLTKDQLDKILEAIKDHDVNVTVDVTGKVICECNCGGNHEGIIGDLEDILG